MLSFLRMDLSFLNPSGGLFYHFRALRYSARLWGPFRAELATWLKGWQPPERCLLVVGPSGGYTLSIEFLSRFERVVCVDPDPMARWIFMRRLGRELIARGVEVRWLLRDAGLSPKGQGFEISGLRSLLEAHTGHAVLFSNVLGQIRMRYSKDRWASSFEGWKRDLLGVLSGRSWASYHDRLSGEMAPRKVRSEVAGALSNSELLARFYAGIDGELQDHETEGLIGSESSVRYFDWELAPRAHYLVEGAFRS